MIPVEVLRECEVRGVTLRAENGHLRFHGTGKAIDHDLLREIETHREELVARLEAEEAWARTAQEVAAAWNAHKGKHGDAPWLPEEEDVPLQEEVGEAIRRGDLQQVRELAERWRKRWLEVLGTDERERVDKRRGETVAADIFGEVRPEDRSLDGTSRISWESWGRLEEERRRARFRTLRSDVE